MNQNIHYTDQQSLDTHITKYHKTSPISDYLQEIVYGGSDGIVTTLAVISGFAGAGAGSLELSVSIVLLFGLANLFADATSMGLGNFLSVRSEKAVWERQLTKQKSEFRSDKEKVFEQTKFLFTKKGYSEQDAITATELIMKNEEHWLQFTLEEEIGISNSYKENSYISSLFTFFSFIAFGFMPLAAYIIPGIASQFAFSISFAAIAMVILGAVRKIVTHESWLRSIGETLLVGGISALIAYGVGTFFG